MNHDQLLERIDAWRAAGLIDDATAGRLRAAESVPATHDAGPAEPPTKRGPGGFAALFGPGVGVGEMFGYIGAAFLLAAWIVLLSRSSGPDLRLAFGLGISAAVLLGLGLWIRGGSARLRRATGVAFLAATAQVGVAVFVLVNELFNPDFISPTREVPPLFAGAGAALVAAIALRRLHPALTTQVALIGGIVAIAMAIMRWLEPILFGPARFEPGAAESPMRVILLAAGWGITAVVLGLVALQEASTRDSAADARAGLTRLAAGLTAVLGTATAVFATGYLGGDDYGRLIPPIVGDLALIIVAVVLLERAFRREASAFVYPAGLGVIIGLSDLNATYLVEVTSAEFALLVEGVILLAAGFAFDRLRRRVTAEGPPTTVEPASDPAPAPTPSRG